MTKKSLVIFTATIVLVMLVDQLTKFYVVSHFSLHETAAVIPGFFHLTYIRNPGAAFGFLAGAPAAFRGCFFALVTLVAVGLILYHLIAHKISDLLLLLPFSLILAGALGNMVDRFRFGEVIDFLDFSLGAYHWPAFNVADMAISIGAAILVVEMFRRRNEEF